MLLVVEGVSETEGLRMAVKEGEVVADSVSLPDGDNVSVMVDESDKEGVSERVGVPPLRDAEGECDGVAEKETVRD